uniref:Uncharacterized protein n=1 Tax=Anguilla anguilla TaxID=7936 RepID=A0A0E9R5A9_ANGAN
MGEHVGKRAFQLMTFCEDLQIWEQFLILNEVLGMMKAHFGPVCPLCRGSL